MKKKYMLFTAVASAAVLAVIAWFAFCGGGSRRGAVENGDERYASADGGGADSTGGERPAKTVWTEDGGDDDEEVAEEEEEPLTEEEKREEAEDAAVEAFDELVDKWTDPAKKEITMADIDKFGNMFRQVPEARRDECVHRALNLVPDENVMLLAGILMDKKMDEEIVQTVFNDILNRDEDVKKPILEQIFKDKTHPCWDDVAWILDVTGSDAGEGAKSDEGEEE
ncbi:MAG: hypothetical protein J6T01_02945 [Kiritimatiellae bacterium]|nr:hypothetical protein [Kiritimatiellia bacterium]